MNSHVLINEETSSLSFNLITIIPMKATIIKTNDSDPFACDYWKFKPDETVFPRNFSSFKKLTLEMWPLNYSGIKKSSKED